MRKLLLLILLLLSTGLEAICEEVDFYPKKTFTLSAAGISLKLPLSAKAAMLPAPTNGKVVAKGKKVDVYAFGDLWRRKQYLGQWKDSQGNLIVLASAQKLISAEQKSTPLSQVAFNSQWKLLTTVDEKNVSSVARWTESFFNLPVKLSPKKLKFKDSTRTVYQLCKQENLFVYSMRRPGTTETIILGMQINPKVSTDKAFRGAVKTLLSLRFIKKEASSKTNKRLQHQTIDRKHMTAEFIGSRRRVIDSIKNLPKWWFVETKNYILTSNLEYRYKKQVLRLQHDIGYLRTAYEQLIPPWKAVKAISVIKVFGDREGYVSYVGEKYRWSGGLWAASKKELVVSPLAKGSKEANTKTLLSTTYHEGFHQYLFYACSEVQAAVWFNEGHAVFFENADIKGSVLLVKEDPVKVQLLAKYINSGQINLAKLLKMDYPDFYSEQNRYYSYTMAWALVYYLRKECCGNSRSPYKNILTNYMAALKNSKNRQRSTEIAFKGIDLKKLTSDFIAFWRNSTKRKVAAKKRLFRAPRKAK